MKPQAVFVGDGLTIDSYPMVVWSPDNFFRFFRVYVLRSCGSDWYTHGVHGGFQKLARTCFHSVSERHDKALQGPKVQKPKRLGNDMKVDAARFDHPIRLAVLEHHSCWMRQWKSLDKIKTTQEQQHTVPAHVAIAPSDSIWSWSLWQD